MSKLSEVFKFMNAPSHTDMPRSFQIGFIKANLREDTGGEFMEIKEAVLARRLKKYKPFFGRDAPRHADPHHLLNQTVNLYDLINDKIVKIHWALIIEFNYRRVYYDGADE